MGQNWGQHTPSLSQSHMRCKALGMCVESSGNLEGGCSGFKFTEFVSMEKGGVAQQQRTALWSACILHIFSHCLHKVGQWDPYIHSLSLIVSHFVFGFLFLCPLSLGKGQCASSLSLTKTPRSQRSQYTAHQLTRRKHILKLFLKQDISL